MTRLLPFYLTLICLFLTISLFSIRAEEIITTQNNHNTFQPQQSQDDTNPCLTNPSTCTEISLVATLGLRGSLWPSLIKDTTEVEDCFDKPLAQEGCLGGCLRRVAYIRHLQHTERVVTVDTGGIYFGTGEVSFTMFGSKPYEICTRESRYDLLSLGGSDVYMGLDVIRDFFITVGRKANALNSLQLQVLSRSQPWANGMESASYFHNNGQSPVIDKVHGKNGGKTTKSQLLHDSRPHPKENDIHATHSRAQEQLEIFALRDHDFIEELDDSQQQFLQVQQQQQQQSEQSSSLYSNDLDEITIQQHDQFTTTQTHAPMFITRPYVISTNLRANNDKWKLFLQPSALVPIPGSTDGSQIAFVSILPNSYNDSLTNPPSWFQISPQYSPYNHVRAEVTRLRRLDVDKTIKAFVLLIQEATNDHSEAFHIEHINAFIMPRYGLTDSIAIQKNIYGNRVLVASVEAGGNVVTQLKFNVQQTTNEVYIIKSIVTQLTAKLMLDNDLESPQTYDGLELSDVLAPFSPNQQDTTPSTALSELMSDVDGREYVIADHYFGYDPATVGCRTSTCPMGLLASKALLSVCHDNHMRTPGSRDCDIAFLNAGAIRGSFFQADGNIDLKSLLKVFPFHNKVVSLDLSGAMIEKILAHAVRSGRSGRFVQSNLRWVYFPYPREPTGISLEDALSRVMDIGVPAPEGYISLMRNQTYRVITLSYLLEGNDGFDTIFDSSFTPENVINHSDSLLTALMSHLRRNRFTWEVSRDELNLCLFNQTLPLVEPTCLMAFSNVTKNDYRSCLSDTSWCSLQSSNYQKAKAIYDKDEAQKKTMEIMNVLMNGEDENGLVKQPPQPSTFSLLLDQLSTYVDSYSTPSWITTQSPKVSLYGSSHNHYLYTHHEEHAIEKEKGGNHQGQIYSNFYSMIPQSDLTTMKPNALPSNLQSEAFYTTPSTGWAKQLFEDGDLYIPLHTSQVPPSAFSTLQATPSNPNIILVNDIPYDPELPPISGPSCGICSGYGFCRDDQQCECSLSSSTDGSISRLILDKGEPQSGLYRNIKMITGTACSTVLVRSNQSNGVVIGITFLAFFAITLSLVSLGIVILFKKHQIIKSAGPDMLIVMCCGALLVSIGLIFHVYDPFSNSQRHFLKLLMQHPEPGWVISGNLKLRLLLSATAICNLQFWFILTGFVVMFGAILAKSYRIHRIFNAKTLNEIRQFTNFRINLLLGAIVAIQILFLILATAISPLEPQAQAFSQGKSQSHTHYWVTCSVPSLNGSASTGVSSRLDRKIVIYIILAVYNFALLAIGMYLSIATRNVDKRFNESNILAFSVYNIVFSAIIFFVTMSSIQSPRGKVAQLAVLSYAILSTIFIMLGSKFKEIYKAYKNKDNEDEMAAPNARLLTFDPILLRTQALERESNLSNTITTQQEQISTLIQHILSSDGDDGEKNQLLNSFEESHHRNATTAETFQRDSSMTSSAKGVVVASPLNADETTTPTKPRFKPDVQQIIDQYCGLELGSVGRSPSFTSGSRTREVAPSVYTTHTRYAGSSVSSNSTTNTENMDESEVRRSKLKGTFRNSHLKTNSHQAKMLASVTYTDVPKRSGSSDSSSNKDSALANNEHSSGQTPTGLNGYNDSFSIATGTFGTSPASGLNALSNISSSEPTDGAGLDDLDSQR